MLDKKGGTCLLSIREHRIMLGGSQGCQEADGLLASSLRAFIGLLWNTAATRGAHRTATCLHVKLRRKGSPLPVNG